MEKSILDLMLRLISRYDDDFFTFRLVHIILSALDSVLSGW